MKCEDALLLISGRLDGNNTAEEENALKAHLQACEECRETLAMLEQVDLTVGELKEAPPPELKNGIMEEIRRETAKQKRRPWIKTAIAAAVCLVIGLGAFFSIPRSDAPQTVSVMQVKERAEMPVSDAETVARKLSQDRNAAVAVVNELYYEIEAYSCETLEEGYLLYILPDHNAAVFLNERYGCVIYEPSNAQQTVAYALLVP